MARTKKLGFEYFPLDVNFYENRKIKRLLLSEGTESIAIFIILLSMIYADKGYYVLVDEYIYFDIGVSCSISEEKVKTIILKMLELNLMNSEKFEQYNILTSKGIQEQYVEMLYRAKRTDEIIDEYNLLDDEKNKFGKNSNKFGINTYKFGKNDNKFGNFRKKSEEMGIKSEFMRQSKVKKSKVKESKINNTADAVDNNIYNNAPVRTSALKQIIAFFQNNTNQSATPVIISEFEKLLEQGATIEIIEEAIKESVVNDKRSMRYIIAIVNNWLAKKVTCVDDIRRLKADFENKKQHQSTARYSLQTNKKVELTQEEIDAMNEVSTPADDEWQEILRNRKSK